MKYFFLLSLIFTSQISLNAVAGWGRGNGGDVIICDSPSPAQNQILDLYELTARYHNHLWSNLSNRQMTDAILQNIFHRVDDYSPGLAYQLRVTYQNLRSKWTFVDSLSVINDIGGYTIPKNCRIRQVANQISQTDSMAHQYTHEYFFDGKAYSQLDPINQATLILHEIFWSIAIDGNWHSPSTSVDIRRETVIAMSEDNEFYGQFPLFFVRQPQP